MKKVYRVYIYRESPSLPKKGWFQGCFICHTVTSDYIFFKMTESHRKVYEYNTYMCSPCQKTKMTDPSKVELINNYCETYISSNILLNRTPQHRDMSESDYLQFLEKLPEDLGHTIEITFDPEKSCNQKTRHCLQRR